MSTEVREGYKQTEVGMIPKDWEVKRLRDIASLHRETINPILFPQESFAHFSLPAFDNGKLPSIDLGDSIASLKFAVPDNAVLLSKLNPRIPRVWLPSLPSDKRSVSSTEFLVLRPKTEKARDYLYTSISSPDFFKKLELIATGTTGSHQRVPPQMVLDLTIYWPNKIEEQRAIASALADVDALLASLEALLTKKRQLKQAAMQELLTGKTRLEGFTEEWEEKRLGNIGQFLKGSGVRKDQAQSGELPCIRYGEIYTFHNDVIKNFISFISRDIANEAIKLKFGDLLFAGSGETKKDIGKCVAFADSFDAYSGGDIVILRPTIKVDPVFMGFYCNLPEIQKQKSSSAQGDAVVHISSSALSKLKLNVPRFPEQQAIASILSEMDAELDALAERVTKTRQLKQGMMQELLTGRTRLI